jgi:DNA-binding NtrC family response regulator
MHQNVLILDDEEDICLYVSRRLQKENLTVKFSLSATEALEMLKTVSFDVIVTDYRLKEMTGIEFFEQAGNEGFLEKTKVILMTAYGTMEFGIDAIKRGFHDYIVKPFDIEDLIFRVRKGIQLLHMNDAIQILTRSLDGGFHGLVGESAEIRKVFTLIRQVAPKDVSVLVEGETGTGKELIAKAIHNESARKNQVFMPIHCGSIPETLLETELFGYEKGAFTGAIGRKIGLLELSDKGTLFLDEINSVSLSIQSKLLRFIETGLFFKVGGTKELKSDIRLITASNENLEQLVKKGKFREDFYHRINVIKIVAPPLRKRKEDIPILFDYFVGFYNARFSKNIKWDKKVLPFLTQYYWEGNVRQLRNLVQNLVLLNMTGMISEDEIPGYLKENVIQEKGILPFKAMKSKAVEEFERKYFTELLKATDGNVLKASQVGQMDRKHLIEKLRHYGIQTRDFKRQEMKNLERKNENSIE